MSSPTIAIRIAGPTHLGTDIGRAPSFLRSIVSTTVVSLDDAEPPSQRTNRPVLAALPGLGALALSKHVCAPGRGGKNRLQPPNMGSEGLGFKQSGLIRQPTP